MKFEYEMCSFPGIKTKEGITVDMDAINAYAKEGWRFIQLHLMNDGYFCIFEREIK